MNLKQIVGRAKQLPVVRQIVIVQQRYSGDNAGLFADALTYKAFFSIFPLLLVATSAIGFLLDDPETQERIVRELTEVIPGFGGVLGDSIQSIVNTRAATGIIGLLGLAWRGTALVRNAGSALSAVKRVDPHDNPVQQFLWAFGAAMTLSLFGVSALVLGILGSVLPDGSVTSFGLFVAAFAADLGLFLIAYRVLTPGAGPPFRLLWPGSLFVAIGWTALKLLGSVVAQQALANATAIYGSLALSIGMLIVLSITARLFMYGAVINALYAEDAFTPAGGAGPAGGADPVDPATRPV